MLTVSLLVCAMMALTGVNGDDNLANVSSVPPEANKTIHIMIPNLTSFAASNCPAGWSKSNGRCFFHEKSKRSWAQAQINCQSLSGNLASIHSNNEYNHIQQMTSEQVWIGGSDCQESSAWFWIDGTAVDYTFWCPSQPDNSNDECCLQMNTGDGKCWDDIACNTLRESICVKNL